MAMLEKAASREQLGASQVSAAESITPLKSGVEGPCYRRHHMLHRPTLPLICVFGKKSKRDGCFGCLRRDHVRCRLFCVCICVWAAVFCRTVMCKNSRGCLRQAPTWKSRTSKVRQRSCAPQGSATLRQFSPCCARALASKPLARSA